MERFRGIVKHNSVLSSASFYTSLCTLFASCVCWEEECTHCGVCGLWVASGGENYFTASIPPTCQKYDLSLFCEESIFRKNEMLIIESKRHSVNREGRKSLRLHCCQSKRPNRDSHCLPPMSEPLSSQYGRSHQR